MMNGAQVVVDCTEGGINGRQLWERVYPAGQLLAA